MNRGNSKSITTSKTASAAEGGRSSCELIEYILAAHIRCDGDTLLMVIVTLIFATILGIPLGLLLYVTRKGNFLENKWVFSILNIIINTIRPIPFIIFLVALSPLTSVIGTTIGTAAAIFPMTLVASIGIARMVETNLVSVPKGVMKQRKRWVLHQLELFLKSLYQKR